MPLEAAQDPLIGSVLEGRFQIERLLGEGGMGRVYVAEELRLRRRCALKVLLPELTDDKGCVERFLREAQAIAQIQHEHVVDIYHLGEDTDHDVVFFAMELLVGQDLEARLCERDRRPITWQQVGVWMEQIAGAMAAVHAAGMIHRDLKPSNVFLTARRDGRELVKLLDFGIAKGADHSAITSTGAALGTPFYMSPEQILAQPLDHRSDIYSFGVLFFEALAGRMPFVGEPIQVAMQHCNLPPPTAASVAPDAIIPRELDDLLQSMLAKDPEARPQTMEEIEAFLHDFLLAHGAFVRPTSGPIPIHGFPASARRSGPVSPDASRLLVGATPKPARSDSPTSPPIDDSAKTHVDARRPPASTVEIHLDLDAGRPARPSPRPLAALLSGVAALGLVLAFAFAGEAPPPAPPHAPALADVAPGPPINVPKPAPPPTAPEPVPSATSPAAARPAAPDAPLGAASQPVPSDSDLGAASQPVPSDSDIGAASQPVPSASDAGASQPVPSASHPDPAQQPAPSDTSDVPADEPLTELQRAADACRRAHGAVDGPKRTVDYAIGGDGSVTRAVPAEADALGACLAEAVRATRFPPQRRRGLTIAL